VAILSFVTLGIYVIFWWYYINRDRADYCGARDTKELGDDPGTSTLALFPGGLVVVPAIWTTVTTFQRTQAAQRLTGQTPLNGWLAFVLVVVFSPAFCGYMQSGLNSAWHSAGSPAEPLPAAV
jgi:heme A synthase